MFFKGQDGAIAWLTVSFVRFRLFFLRSPIFQFELDSPTKTCKKPNVEMAESNGTTTFEIPKKCKAGVVVNEGPDFHVEVQEVDVPEIATLLPSRSFLPIQFLTYYPGPEDVLIKLNCTGICHSDLHFMLADWGIGKMSDFGTRCAGHEGAGFIVKIGANVKTLKVGQRAGFKPIADTCGSCELCRTDKECYCTAAVLTGLHVDGAMVHSF